MGDQRGLPKRVPTLVVWVVWLVRMVRVMGVVTRVCQI